MKNKSWIYGEYCQDQWKKIFDLDLIEIQDSMIDTIYFDSVPQMNTVSEYDIEDAAKIWQQLTNDLDCSALFQKICSISNAGHISISDLKKNILMNLVVFLKENHTKVHARLDLLDYKQLADII